MGTSATTLGIPRDENCQAKQIRFAWRYLILAVDVIHLDLKWTWSSRMNQTYLKPIFEHWHLDTIIWDGATAHRGREMAKLGMKCIFLPSFIHPNSILLERIFEEVRRHIEGIVYPSLDAKQNRIDQFLRQLRADKDRLRSLVCVGNGSKTFLINSQLQFHDVLLHDW